MSPLPQRELHVGIGARFAVLGGGEVVADYGDPDAEYAAIVSAAGVIDLSFRGRICLTGADRVRLLHGQVTNDIVRLGTGEGCHAAFTTPKGRMQADVHVYALEAELLLDFEPGLSAMLLERLDHHIVADDVQVVDVAPHYGLLSVQGPAAAEVVARIGLPLAPPAAPHGIAHLADPDLGDLYLADHRRAGLPGLDLFVPSAAAAMVLDKLVFAARRSGGRACGWDALDLARFEAGIPRFGADMDETNLPPEAGLDHDAISYTKGCYIGQETIARIRTYGQVTKALRGLRLPDGDGPLPLRGDKLVREGREVGHLTGAVRSPAVRGNIALGYVRKECNAPGTQLRVRSAAGELHAEIVPLPFRAS